MSLGSVNLVQKRVVCVERKEILELGGKSLYYRERSLEGAAEQTGF